MPTTEPAAATDAPTPRRPLNRERVLQAALGLADREGIDALSMRRLAQDLGVEAMTLYYHVRNKGDLLDGLADLVTSEFEPPRPGDPWKPAVRAAAISAHDALMRHPWAAELSFKTSVSQARLHWMDAFLGTLRAGGFSPAMTHHAYHALDSHIVGFTLWVVGITSDEADLPAMAATFLATLPVDGLPHLVEHIEQHVHPSDDIREFEFGLDLILDSLDRIRSDGGTA
jgi:AcrR family transcriptional regulator